MAAHGHPGQAAAIADMFQDSGVAHLAQEVGLMSGQQGSSAQQGSSSHQQAGSPMPGLAHPGASHLSPSTPRTPGHSSHLSPQASPWSVGQKRGAEFESPDERGEGSKRRRAPPSSSKTEDKSGRGLRHFSMKVCQKVQEKGTTTYNEVADELVAEQQLAEELEDGGADGEIHGPKNIRRRVYDALNVLMAMNIISKEKKEIRWIGLPSNSAQECKQMEEMREKKLERIRKKTAHLQELIVQQIAFKNLVRRNEASRSMDEEEPPENAIHLPFIVVNTSKDTVIDCQMAEDKSEYFFNFNKPFEIHDDIEILKRMRLAHGIETGTCTAKELAEAKTMIPKALEPYLTQMVHTIIPDQPSGSGGQYAAGSSAPGGSSGV